VNVTVLTAIGDPRREAELAAGLHDIDLGVTVVRRCVDIADLLAAGSAGLAQAVLLSADLRRLDRAAVQRLRQAGLAVVAIAPDDVGARDRLRRLGIETVIAEGAPAAGVAAAVVSAVSGITAGPAEPAAVYPTGPEVPVGRMLAVWGAVGAPGRSSVAVNLAVELAGLGHPTLCVDLDTYGASLAQLVGLLDDGSGVAAACRAANAGELDVATLRELAAEVRPGLRLLTGITGPHRWPELRAASLEVVFDRAKQAFQYVVVDVGFCVELDEELSYDTVAPRRNGAAVDVLKAADSVVAVAAADPIGIARFVRAVGDLPRVADESGVVTVINRVRRSAIGRGDPAQQIALALGRYADIADSVMVPDDPAMADAAVATGRTWSEIAPSSAARVAVRKLARQVAGDSMATTRPRRRLLQIRS
jgi:MinD-like ATPase involved in chromosome partitioning or flagellar assembly